MNKRGVLIVLTMILFVPLAWAGSDKAPMKRVPTLITGQLMTLYRAPLLNPGDSITIEIRKFSFKNTPWPKADWDTVVCRPDPSGRFALTARLPVDSAFIMRNWSTLQSRSQVPVNILIRVLDKPGRHRSFQDGIRIVLSGLGKVPWLVGTDVAIEGRLDDVGLLWATVQLPLNSATRKNFWFLANNQGQ